MQNLEQSTQFTRFYQDICRDELYNEQTLRRFRDQWFRDFYSQNSTRTCGVSSMRSPKFSPVNMRTSWSFWMLDDAWAITTSENTNKLAKVSILAELPALTCVSHVVIVSKRTKHTNMARQRPLHRRSTDVRARELSHSVTYSLVHISWYIFI